MPNDTETIQALTKSLTECQARGTSLMVENQALRRRVREQGEHCHALEKAMGKALVDLHDAHAAWPVWVKDSTGSRPLLERIRYTAGKSSTGADLLTVRPHEVVFGEVESWVGSVHGLTEESPPGTLEEVQAWCIRTIIEGSWGS